MQKAFKLTKRMKQNILIVLVTLLVCLTCCSGVSRKEADRKYQAAINSAAVELFEQWKQEQIAINEEEDRADRLETSGAIDPELKAEAEEIAKVLYGQARWNSVRAQQGCCWCIINRVESSMYADTVAEVCRQPSQWMGQSDENPVTQELYEVALSCLSAWKSGDHRLVDEDFLFLGWSRDEIVLRTTFDETANTRYWRSEGGQ